MRDLSTLDTQLLLREATRRDQVKRWQADPMVFAKEVFPHHFPRPFARFHHEIMKLSREKTADGVKRVGLAAPATFGKSKLCSFLLPMTEIVFGHKHFIVLISNTYMKACEFLNVIKHEFDTNECLRRAFPTLRPTPNKWAEGEIEITQLLPNGQQSFHKILAMGAGQSFRGKTYLQYRPDLVILDDVEDDEQVRSDTRRGYLEQWLNGTVLQRSDAADVIMVGTVLHEGSLLNHIVRKPDATTTRLYEGWNTRLFRALENDTSLWPEFLTVEQLKEQQNRDPYGFATEKQNDPVPPDFCPFKPEFFTERRYWSQLPRELTISITLDPACTDKEYSDETAITTAGWDAQGRLWVLNEIAGKYVNPSDIIDLLMEEYLRWTKNEQVNPGHHVFCVGIEKISFQKFLVHLFKQACVARNLHPFVKELKGDRDKTRRIWQLEPLFRENHIFLRPDMTALEHQLKAFPNGQHDDRADALAYHVQLGAILPQGLPDEPDASTAYDLTYGDYIRLSEQKAEYARRFPDVGTRLTPQGVRPWYWMEN